MWMTKTDRTLFQCDFAIHLNSFYALAFQFFLPALRYICWSCTSFIYTHRLTHHSQFKRVTHFEPKSKICLFQQYSILNTSIKNSICFDLIWKKFVDSTWFVFYYHKKWRLYQCLRRLCLFTLKICHSL